MKLIQIPFSHNCIKVRVALNLKGLAFEIEDISPTDRSAVKAASSQGLVPVLVDGSETITDSTRILLHLEERYPDPPLVPRDAPARAECLLLEDWADHAFMTLSRRIAYVNTLARPGSLGALFFPNDKGPVLWVKERLARRVVSKRFGLSPRRHRGDLVEARRLAALALARLGGSPWLLGQTPTIADVSLATMSAPLWADRELRDDPAVLALLSWGEALVPADVRTGYRG